MDPPPPSPAAKSDIFGGGYNKYPCPNWQQKGHPSNYDFVYRKDELCAHCMGGLYSSQAGLQAAKREDAIVAQVPTESNRPSSSRRRAPPPLSFPVNFNQDHARQPSARRPSLAQDLPFAAASQDPWDLRNVKGSLPSQATKREDAVVAQESNRPSSSRRRAPPPLSFPVNFNQDYARPPSTRRPYLAQDLPFATASQDPWDLRNVPQSLFAERGSDSGEDLQMVRSDRDEFVESVESRAKAERQAGLRDSESEEDTDTDDAMVMNFSQKNKMKPPSLIHVRRSKSQSQSQGSGALRSRKKKLGHATEGDDRNSGREILDPVVAIPEKEGHDRLTSKPEEVTSKASATDHASSWRDGRGTKERRQTRFSRATTDDIEEDVESGTASSLRKARVVRERKHNESSKAKKEDIDDELEDYDGQEEDFVADSSAH